MKAAYTGWTWIHGDQETAKRQLEQSFKECKFLGYDTVENFAFIRDYYKDDPGELRKLADDCGVELVDLDGHFDVDMEGSLNRAMEQVDFLSEIGGK